jgi:O-antigen/teichoic acid export membrane protein
LKDDRFTFFRQTSWLVIATVVNGLFMTLVHSAAQRMPKDPETGQTEYGLFFAMLQMLGQLAIPALGLQSVFAQQVGAATDDRKRAELVGTIRGVLKLMLVFWVIAAVLAVVFQDRFLATFKVANPLALWITLAVALVSLVSPIFGGLVQGRQDFLWFGLGTILNGVGRFLGVALLVALLHKQTAGAMAGVLAGASLVLVVFMWRTRETWTGPSAPFDWRAWLRRVVPLTLALGAVTYVFTEDALIVRRFFEKGSDEYGAARVIGNALVFLTAPLGHVLFPKVARSHALSEKSNVLLQALGATGLIGVGAALVCTVAPWLPLRIIGSAFPSSAWLVPWFAWCMIPLTVANVLINNLLARERYSAVPWLVAVAAGYGITLRYMHDSLIQVIQVMGVFGLLLVAVAVIFTVRTPDPKQPRSPPA